MTVHAAGRGNPKINLSDGHDLLTSYVGPQELTSALEQNLAKPLSLTSADFDEDGMPDLVSGYEYLGHGIITLHPGNVDSIYPNTAEAKQRKAKGAFTDAPFLSSARAFQTPATADFIGAGDFDADSHWDVVVGSRSQNSLFLLSGNGNGELRLTKQIGLTGLVTALTTGEVNRPDGLTDIVVGVASEKGSGVLVFEGPEGALRAEPEVLKTVAPVSSLALGQFDASYEADLAVAAGRDLVLVRGRDRKLSLDSEQQKTVKPPRVESRLFDETIVSLAAGRFGGAQEPSLALLTGGGRVHLLTGSPVTGRRAARRDMKSWLRQSVATAPVTGAPKLIVARVSSLPGDDIIVAGEQLQLLAGLAGGDNAPSDFSLGTATAPVAVLPMRLNSDALPDLVVLRENSVAPSVASTMAPQTFVVTNTNATGAGSLQFAILDANENPGADLISFNIPGAGPQTINLTAALPTITDTVTIDGTTQPGYQGTPLIQINGLDAKGSNGLVLAANSCVVRALAITGFDFNPNQFDPVTLDGGGAGISVRSSNNIIEGNHLGYAPFMYAGVRAVGVAVNNTIGGTVLAARNVMSVGFAVLLPTGADNNRIQGNIISGNVLGVSIGAQFGAGGTGNTVGGTAAGARNVIFGYRTGDGAGVRISGNGTLVQGNYLGTNESGTAASTPVSQGYGVQFYSPDVGGNTVGGTTPAARNLISANGESGVRQVTGSHLTGTPDANVVQGNFIGTDVSGSAGLGNNQRGVFVDGVNKSNIEIGGTVAGAGNIVSGNKQSGIEIMGTGTHVVQGNFIGTDVTGTLDLGNVQNGIYLNSTSNNTIGGITNSSRNVISGNGLSGVLIEGTQATGNTIQGNFIGTNASGTAAIGNDLNGVTTSQAPNNTIGGATIDTRNIISANGRHGVSIGIDTSSGATGITVQNNYIGTDITGNNCFGNLRDGVFVNRGSVNHTITDNLITCNGRNGVNIPNFATNDPGIQIQVVQNSIYANALLGIDLGDAGITANDPQDEDSGANLQQNFPILTSAMASAAGETIWERAGEMGREMPDPILAAALTINGTLNSTPNTNFTVHWYFSADAQCTTNQAASRPLSFGKVPSVITDGSGNATFSIPFNFPSGINGGIVNCTATDPQGNTSEFSACFPVSTTPGPTPTPTPSPTPTGPSIFVEEGTNNLAAVDSVTSARGPFPLSNPKNFSSDQRTRIIFFTTNLGLPQTFQPATSALSVQVGGNSYPVERVGPDATISGSYIVFRLPDLSPGTYPLGIRLNGVNSANAPNLTIIASPSGPAAAPKSNKANLARYVLFSLIDLIL